MKFGIIELSQPDKAVEEYPYQGIHERVTREIIEADKGAMTMSGLPNIMPARAMASCRTR